MRRSKYLAFALVGALFAWAGPGEVQAQAKYPTKPIRVINPYAPGGAVDIVARIVREPMRAILGQPLVLENKPGGFGMIAGQDLVNAPPDGYTLWFGNVNTHAVWPIVHKKKYPFDFAKMIVPVATVADVPAFLAVTTRDFAPNSLKEALDYAKKNPGAVRYSSIGVGSFPHFDMAMIARRAGVEMTHVPSKGGAGMVQDIATGDAHMGFVNVASSGPLVRSGRLRAFAVVNKERLPDFPDVPTLDELGFAGTATHHWLGIFARTGTPDHIIATLQKAANEAAKRPEIVDLLKKQSMTPFLQESPEAARAWLKGELDRWENTVKEVNIKIE
jgi:tripartite-type tricarboxylate transporter receptor subunit TctC